MGLGAGASSASAGSSAATSLLSPVTAGVGGLFVAVALVLLLAYLDLFDAADVENPQLRRILVAVIIPLAMTFGAIVLFESLRAL